MERPVWAIRVIDKRFVTIEADSRRLIVFSDLIRCTKTVDLSIRRISVYYLASSL